MLKSCDFTGGADGADPTFASARAIKDEWSESAKKESMRPEVIAHLAGSRSAFRLPIRVTTHLNPLLNPLSFSRLHAGGLKSTVTAADLALGGATGEHADQE